MVRIFFLIAGLLLGSVAIFLLFTIQENSQQNYYMAINTEKKSSLDSIKIREITRNIALEKRGYFFHFTSENCPYNNLGYESLISLYSRFNKEITFIIIYDNKQTLESLKELIKKHRMSHVLLMQDEKQDIKKVMNVRSLPRAVIINNALELFYEGNYNHSSILCGFGSIDYGQIALAALIKGESTPNIDYFVLKETDCVL